MDNGILWGWLIWSAAAMLFVPALIYTIKLEVDDVRRVRRAQGPQTRSEIEESKHRTAA